MKDAALSALGPLPPTVSVRLGDDLGWEISRRKGDLGGAGAVVKRDLGRYYAAMRAALELQHFSKSDASIVCFVLRTTDITPETARFLWADFDEQARRIFGIEEMKAAKFDELTERLRTLKPFEALAILDAVQSYWSIRDEMVFDGTWDDMMDDEVLSHVGFLPMDRRRELIFDSVTLPAVSDVFAREHFGASSSLEGGKDA